MLGFIFIVGIAFLSEHTYCNASEGFCNMVKIVDDFECIFLEYDSNSDLSCSFIQAADKDSDHSNSFHLQHRDVQVTCQCAEKLSYHCRMQCVFGARAFNKFSNQYHFTVRKMDEVGNWTQDMTISRAQCMVMEQPGIEVDVVNQTSSSICLQWEHKSRSNHNYDIIWDLQLQPQFSFEWKPPQYAELKETFCLKGLPFANYEYKLQLRRCFNTTKAHWSDYFNYTFQTEPKVELSSASAILTYNLLKYMFVYYGLFFTIL